jgi:tetratricopeptide (TPR) repeat protein
MTMIESRQDVSRLQQLLGFLDHDPENLALLSDAAAAAIDEGDFAAATSLVKRYAAAAEPPPQLLNLQALAAMREGRFEDAAASFAALRAGGWDAPPVRFNHAWALAMANEPEAALALLDDEVCAAGSRGAALKVSLLHQLERLDEALAEGARLAEIYPDDQNLMGALANAALDAEQAELARAYAARAGTSHDGLTTLGMLLLDEERIADSGALFDRVLAADGSNARAQLGKGLGLLAAGDSAGAARWIDGAAERFGDHVGSWVAAGWAQYLLGDLAASRARFETALAIDDSFAETQGALAVLDIAADDLESARRRADVALRLDRQCFAAALAKTMLLERDGKGKAAQKVRDAALNLAIGPGGRTIARSLAARRSEG